MYLLFDIQDLLQLINDNVIEQLDLIYYYDTKYDFKIKLTILDTRKPSYNLFEFLEERQKKYKYVRTLLYTMNGNLCSTKMFLKKIIYK